MSMVRVSGLKLPVDHDEEDLEKLLAARLGLKAAQIVRYQVRRKSIDARKRGRVNIVYIVDVEVHERTHIRETTNSNFSIRSAPDESYRMATKAVSRVKTRPVVVGTGPCGLFAGLLLAEMGFRPILLERGKRVTERARDVYQFWQTGQLDPGSNVQFGEGGAGTFSDGKLTTQIGDRNNRCRKVLDTLVACGAPEEILYLQKPHIGTDLLVGVVGNLHDRIVAQGGEVRFLNQVTDLIIENGSVRGAKVQNQEELRAECVILAIGHSARDTFQMLFERNVPLQPKPFSIGVRIEHPQTLIDQAQYGECAGHPNLGHADYKLVHHASSGRSAYTFCVCPGGEVIAASSEPGGIVTNGMSRFARNSTNGNSALLVGVHPTDFAGSPLAGVQFQRRWEQKAFQIAGADYKAPAQRVGDFLKERPSETLGSVLPSYKPGVHLGTLDPCLPKYVIETLREAIPAFGRRIQGFAMSDAVLTGVETRSSSPVRILRRDSFESVGVRGLYPAGEGAGYAGGIMSSAVDGIKVAEAAALKLVES